jgi:ABC-type polar amino acid transport system ATPase subunit
VSETLTVRGLELRRGDRAVLRGIDIDVAAGEICALMGPSGVGKSTALRAIAALEPFDAGTIAIGDFKLRPGPVPPQSRLKPFRRKVGVVFQSAALFDHLTVLDNVTLGPVHALGWAPDRARGVATALLEDLGVASRANAFPRQISGGEAQRVAIARALAPDPMVLLMDEPTSALDPARRGALGEALRHLATSGRGLLISTHDIDFARLVADRVYVLGEGSVVAHGHPADVLRAGDQAATAPAMQFGVAVDARLRGKEGGGE